MSSIMKLVGKKMSQEVKFMGEKVKISKLSISQVEEIQELSKDLEANPDKGFDVMKKVLRSAVEGGEELQDDDFKNFPMDEMASLTQAIMAFSGVSGKPEDKVGK
jgi:hypothetical protein